MYKLLTYQDERGPRAGLLVNDNVFDVQAFTNEKHDDTVLGILDDWREARGRLESAAEVIGQRKPQGKPLHSVQLLAPLLYPRTIYCTGSNYSDHVAEMARRRNAAPDPDPRELGLKSWHFIKVSRCVVGAGAAIDLPALSNSVDWEIEMAVVIGLRAKNLPAEEALGCVAGYTIANDLSARDLGVRPHLDATSAFKRDWVAHKCFDGACPLGPWIVPAQQIPDPQNLGLKLSLNGVVKQDSNTRNMIFSVAEQIAHLTERITLWPGDVILTGTPAGCGAPDNQFLEPGDELRLSIERIGELAHSIARS